MTESDEDLVREIYASVEVIKSQQSEIYRRLGRVEKKLEDGTLGQLQDRLESLETDDPWYKRPFWAALAGALGLGLGALVMRIFGIEIPMAL